MQNDDVSIKKYYQNLKDEFNELKELDSEINNLEEASNELENKYRVIARFLDVKKGCKNMLLYLGAVLFIVSMVNIDLLLIGGAILTTAFISCGVLLKNAYQNVKKINKNIPCFGISGRDNFTFLKSKHMSILKRIEAKKNRKEELFTKLGSYTPNGEFSTDFYDMLFKRVDQVDRLYQESLNATLKEDVSHIHFDNSIGSEIDYTEKTKKLFKKM